VLQKEDNDWVKCMQYEVVQWRVPD